MKLTIRTFRQRRGSRKMRDLSLNLSWGHPGSVLLSQASGPERAKMASTGSWLNYGLRKSSLLADDPAPVSRRLR